MNTLYTIYAPILKNISSELGSTFVRINSVNMLNAFISINKIIRTSLKWKF